ncbi:MAG: helix-turn-helix domain-containing protein [Bacilli bacterium]|nr:helix-turn-helix domain-containing protein [Bacilli bacterium]
MTIGERLLNYRKANNLSQEEVAEKLEVTRQTISKWETDQSTPDFDKIGPLCDLFNITADELINGRKPNVVGANVKSSEQDERLNKGLVVAGSVFLYFLSVTWIIFGSEFLNLNEGVLVSVFMLICAIATCLLIFYFVTRDRSIDKENKKALDFDADPVKKAIKSILSLLITCIYILISFWTMAWHITWIIWLIYAAIVSLIDLLFDLRRNDDAK